MAKDKWMSNGELSELLCKDQSTISHTIKQFKIKPNKYKKYSLRSVLEAFEAKRQRDSKNLDPSNPRHQKTLLECDILREKLKQIRGESISLEDHEADVTEIAEVVNAGLEQWVQWVAAIKRNPALLKKTKEIRDNVKRWMIERIGE